MQNETIEIEKKKRNKQKKKKEIEGGNERNKYDRIGLNKMKNLFSKENE